MMGKKAELILDRVMSQIILNNNKTGNFHKHQHFRKKMLQSNAFRIQYKMRIQLLSTAVYTIAGVVALGAGWTTEKFYMVGDHISHSQRAIRMAANSLPSPTRSRTARPRIQFALNHRMISVKRRSKPAHIVRPVIK
jgi:hypothetical protein